MLQLLVDKDKSVYANLNLKDEVKLLKYMQEFSPNIQKEKQITEKLLGWIEKPKEEIDFPVLANLMKSLVLIAQAREELHQEGYERTISLLIDTILNEIYGFEGGRER